MDLISDFKIYSSRELNAPVEIVYQAFANPSHLKKWWGPKGFTNTIHEFDIRPEGKWLLTMHGPEKGNYENSSIFKTVELNKTISWSRLSQPLFNMEVNFEKIDDANSKISFVMVFETIEACNKMKPYVLPNNEENFDRLEKELKEMIKSNEQNI